MPVFVEDPAGFSKQRLMSELVSHKVTLPDAESKKQVYVDLYMKHIGEKSAADFSSDEEDQVQNEKEEKEDPEMLDPRGLTDDDLKATLLKYGVKAGPIVASTRALYEKKLQSLLQPAYPAELNGAGDTDQYSDSEEEDMSVSEQAGPETVSHLDQSQQEDSQKAKKQHGRWKSNPRRNAGNVMESSAEWGQVPLSLPLVLTPSMARPRRAQPGEPVTDVLMEIFPDLKPTPTGIAATRRRPIKGAAGRPVQFKYPDAPPLSPTTVERQELEGRLVPLWVQIVVFLIIVCLLYLIYVCVEDSSDNPLVALLENLSLETGDAEVSLEAGQAEETLLLNPDPSDTPVVDALSGQE